MLEKETRKVENEIQKVLQGYFDKTGLIPVSVGFHALDIRTMQDHEAGRKAIIVSGVSLQVNT